MAVWYFYNVVVYYIFEQNCPQNERKLIKRHVPKKD